MKKIQSFTDLYSWQMGHRFVINIYNTTKKFPIEERYSLTNKIRRVAVSVTSNIAEGFSRKTVKEKQQFYSIALASITEIQNQLLISKDIGYLNQDNFNDLAKQSLTVAKLLNGLTKSAENKKNITY